MAKEFEFWISNVSNKNVTLADLRLSIPARSHMNLLKKGHFYYTIEQLEASATSGSLYNKRNIIKVRKVAPEEPKVKPGKYIANQLIIPSKHKYWSQVKIKEEHYEELDISEEAFVDQLTEEDPNS